MRYIYALKQLRLINFYTLGRFRLSLQQSQPQVVALRGEVGERGLEVFDPSDLSPNWKPSADL
jgi:hypothetical protein